MDSETSLRQYLVSEQRKMDLEMRLAHAQAAMESLTATPYSRYLARLDVELYSRLLKEMERLRASKK